ncbi:MAG: zinc ribbon domain-containing protein [Gemmataceae bacterium]
MPGHATYDDEEWEDGDEADDAEATVPCPYCQREIHEDAPRCPYCGNYISEEDTPPARKPGWIIVGVLLGLFAAYYWIVGW